MFAILDLASTVNKGKPYSASPRSKKLYKLEKLSKALKSSQKLQKLQMLQIDSKRLRKAPIFSKKPQTKKALKNSKKHHRLNRALNGSENNN